jgi:nicotinamide-nucleotide amidase
MASAKQVTYSFAESCTGGLVASKITDLPDASAYFKGGVVSYSNQAKINLLGVRPETLDKFGAVSIEVATEMALGSLSKFNTDYAISITGIAGPSGGTSEIPAGTVVIGFAGKKISGARMYLFPGDRMKRKERFSEMALLILLELMEDKIELIIE